MDHDTFVLDEQLCFALHTASRAMTGCYRPLLDELGLTYSQYAVMLVLWEREAVTLQELGSRLQLDSGTLSPLLQRLDAAGLITRRRRPEDERTLLVSVTQEGRRLRDAAAAAQVEVQRTTGLTPEALAELRESLVALAARLRAPEAAPAHG